MSMRPVLTLLAALVAALALAPAGAGASTVTLRYLRTTPGTPGGKQMDPVPPTDVFAAVLRDDDGRDDQVEVDGRGRIREAGALAGPGCAADAEGWIACTAAPATPGNLVDTTVLLETGAGNDHVTLAAPGVLDATADLGPGDDVVRAEGGWALHGGDGADTLVSAAQVTADHDRVDADGPVWDGGPGPDRVSGATVTVTYAGRAAPVRVTPDGDDELHAAPGGASGGPGDDLIVGRPVLVGPLQARLDGDDGDDVLRGGAASERLDGGAGDDRVDGGGGDDVLQDGPGADRVDGGPGDDEMGPYVVDHARDVFSGGPGDDRLDGSPIAGPLRVSLDDRANDGTSGEHDDVRADFEHVSLRRGTLIGSPHDDDLEVDEGGTIDGRGGDDALSGLARMTGGPGRDELSVFGSTAQAARARADLRDGHGGDRASCAFSPVVVRADRGDHAVGCARPAVVASVAPAQRRRLAPRGTVDVELRCFGRAELPRPPVAGGRRTPGRVDAPAARRPPDRAGAHPPPRHPPLWHPPRDRAPHPAPPPDDDADHHAGTLRMAALSADDAARQTRAALGLG